MIFLFFLQLLESDFDRHHKFELQTSSLQSRCRTCFYRREIFNALMLWEYWLSHRFLRLFRRLSASSAHLCQVFFSSDETLLFSHVQCEFNLCPILCCFTFLISPPPICVFCWYVAVTKVTMEDIIGFTQTDINLVRLIFSLPLDVGKSSLLLRFADNSFSGELVTWKVMPAHTKHTADSSYRPRIKSILSGGVISSPGVIRAVLTRQELQEGQIYILIKHLNASSISSERSRVLAPKCQTITALL